MNTAAARLAILAAIPATAAIFLPFTYDTSPLDAFAERDVWSLAWPFFAGPIAGIVALRLTAAGTPSAVERAGAWLVAVLLTGVTLWSMFMMVRDSAANWRDVRLWLAVAAPVIVLLLAAGVTMRIHRSAASAFAPVIALAGPFAANAILCSIAFLGDWQSGAYTALAAVVIHVAVMGRALAQTAKARRVQRLA